MTDSQRLKLADDILDSDGAFLADCAAMDKIMGKVLTENELKTVSVIIRLYQLIHPRFSACSHRDWEDENEKKLASLESKTTTV